LRLDLVPYLVCDVTRKEYLAIETSTKIDRWQICRHTRRVIAEEKKQPIPPSMKRKSNCSVRKRVHVGLETGIPDQNLRAVSAVVWGHVTGVALTGGG
jgi:hypothetical protein